MVKARQLRRSTVCLNCGTALLGNFCSECGQENTDYRVSLGRLLRDLTEEVLNIESRLWRSLWHLGRHPGRLTRDYNFGRRVRYTSPLRLYLLCSIAYFFVAALGSGPTHVVFELPEVSVEDTAPNRVGQRVREHVSALGQLTPEERSRHITQLLATTLPKIFVALVPVFALILMAFFRGHLYVEHLVLSLHAHAFGFGISTLALLTRSDAVLGWTLLAPAVWATVALHEVYNQSWPRVVWKSLAIALLYTIVAALAVSVVLLVGLFLF